MSPDTRKWLGYEALSLILLFGAFRLLDVEGLKDLAGVTMLGSSVVIMMWAADLRSAWHKRRFNREVAEEVRRRAQGE